MQVESTTATEQGERKLISETAADCISFRGILARAWSVQEFNWLAVHIPTTESIAN